LLRLALSGGLPIVAHHQLVYEYRDVLSRPATLGGSGPTFAKAEIVPAHLIALASPVNVRYLWRPNLAGRRR
jgi:hypothetical protein